MWFVRLARQWGPSGCCCVAIDDAETLGIAQCLAEDRVRIANGLGFQRAIAPGSLHGETGIEALDLDGREILNRSGTEPGSDAISRCLVARPRRRLEPKLLVVEPRSR